MIEAERAEAHFNAVADRFMAPMDDLLELCYPEVVQSNRDNFNSQATPQGRDWKERKDPGDGHPLLQESGDMMQAAVGGGPGHIHHIETDDEGRSLVVGVDLDIIAYARAQALGYKPNNLPARNYLGLTPRGEQIVETILSDGMERRFDGSVAAVPGSTVRSAS